LQLHP